MNKSNKRLLCILEIIGNESKHGYQIMLDYFNAYNEKISTSTLYEVLYKQADDGVLEVIEMNTNIVEGKKRRYYKLTPKGGKLLEIKRAEAEIYQEPTQSKKLKKIDNK